MATAICASDPTPNQDLEKPNHMIIWLDDHIGKAGECTHLKKAFAMNTDPRQETWTMLKDDDFDKLIVTGDAVLVEFNGVKFLLQALNNVNACVEAFERNQDKRIFFITSGTLGEKVVPQILENYRNIFTDLTKNEPYPSVYIFCLHIAYHLTWAGDHLEYIQMFNSDSELLERMTRDVAEYFVDRGERILEDDREPTGALNYLHWAKILRHQYDKMQQGIRTGDFREVQLTTGMKDILAKIKNIETQYPTKSSDGDNTNNDHQQDSDSDDQAGHEPS